MLGNTAKSRLRRRMYRTGRRWGQRLARLALCLGLLTLTPTLHAQAPDAEVARNLAQIAQAGPEGQGSAAAREARDELARQGVEILPQLLVAMDTPNPVAANWYRTAYEEIVGRALAKK